MDFLFKIYRKAALKVDKDISRLVRASQRRTRSTLASPEDPVSAEPESHRLRARLEGGCAKSLGKKD